MRRDLDDFLKDNFVNPRKSAVLRKLKQSRGKMEDLLALRGRAWKYNTAIKILHSNYGLSGVRHPAKSVQEKLKILAAATAAYRSGMDGLIRIDADVRDLAGKRTAVEEKAANLKREIAYIENRANDLVRNSGAHKLQRTDHPLLARARFEYKSQMERFLGMTGDLYRKLDHIIERSKRKKTGT